MRLWFEFEDILHFLYYSKIQTVKLPQNYKGLKPWMQSVVNNRLHPWLKTFNQ